MKIVNKTNHSAIVKAPAKINLCFEILHKRNDGYHEIRTIASTIPFYDTIHIKTFQSKKNHIQITTNNPKLPTDEANNCHKACYEILKKINSKHSIKIHLQKKIPIGSGMGGSSTDAASVLMTLNLLLKLKYSKKDLHKIANKIGSDLGIFIYQGTTFSFSRGDETKLIKSHPINLPILLLLFPTSISTQKAYRNLPIKNIPKERVDICRLQKNAILEENIYKISTHLYNDLELSKIINQEKLNYHKNLLKQAGALNSLLSGSGSTMYGIFENNATLTKAYQKLKSKLEDIQLIKLIKK